MDQQKKRFLFSVSGILLRPVLLSFPYLLFLFYLPFVPVAAPRSIRGEPVARARDFYWLLTWQIDFPFAISSAGHTGYYLKLLIFVSTLLCLAQSAFQILLAVLGNELIAKCEFLEILLRHVGVVRFDELE